MENFFRRGEKVKKILSSLFLISIILYSGISFGIGGGDITFKPQKAKKVVYSHDFHTYDGGIFHQ
jgi:hypothetical protein